MLRSNSADSKQNQLKLKFERTILSCNFSAGALFLGLSGTGELLFPLGLWGLAILVQSQGIIYLLFRVFGVRGKGNTAKVTAKVAMGTGP